MKKRQIIKITQLMVITVLLGSACSLGKKTSLPPIEVTKESLKAHFKGSTVKFIEKGLYEKPYTVTLAKVKFAFGGPPRKVSFVGMDHETYEYDELIAKLRPELEARENSGMDDKSIAISATEADLQDYKKKGIYISDFRELVAELQTETDQIYIDLVGSENLKTR